MANNDDMIRCRDCSSCVDRIGNYKKNDGVCLLVGRAVEKSKDWRGHKDCPCGYDYIDGDWGPKHFEQKNNWNEYYSSPEKASLMTMEYVIDTENSRNGVVLYKGFDEIATVWYGDDDNICAAMLEWMWKKHEDDAIQI